eukprot:888985-Rhodomonas_salina.2
MYCQPESSRLVSRSHPPTPFPGPTLQVSQWRPPSQTLSQNFEWVLGAQSSTRVCSGNTVQECSAAAEPECGSTALKQLSD